MQFYYAINAGGGYFQAMETLHKGKQYNSGRTAKLNGVRYEHPLEGFIRRFHR